MTDRRKIAAVVALLALLLGAACSEPADASLVPETEDPLYVQGVQLKRQNRFSEALTSFLKVIERRGERASAESHLEAGSLYLNHTKDPVAAYYHFRKYLELQPNSKQAPYVRGMVEAAKREFYRTLAAAPRDDPGVRLAGDEEVARLRRENDELRAELQVLRGGGGQRTAAKVITLPDEQRTNPAPPPTAPIVDPGARATPAPRQAGVTTSFPQAAPATTRAGAGNTPPRPNATAPAARSGVTHTVKPKESLYSIARQHNVKLEDLARANGIQDPSKVPAGTVLKIP